MVYLGFSVFVNDYDNEPIHNILLALSFSFKKPTKSFCYIAVMTEETTSLGYAKIELLHFIFERGLNFYRCGIARDRQRQVAEDILLYWPITSS